MVFQRVRDLDEKDWTSAAQNDFLEAAINVSQRSVEDQSSLRSKIECDAMWVRFGLTVAGRFNTEDFFSGDPIISLIGKLNSLQFCENFGS